MSDTKLEQWCIDNHWTCVEFDQVYIDEIFEDVVDAALERFCVIPMFNRGYDDPLTSKIYFSLPSDAYDFEKAVSNKVTIVKAATLAASEVHGYYHFVEDHLGFVQVAIVDKAYHDQYGDLNENGLSDDAETELPERFNELAPCLYVHFYPSNEEAKKALFECGFVEKDLS